MKRFWQVLLILTSLLSVFFIGKMAREMVAYFSLDQQGKALAVKWEVVEKSPSAFALAASYHFLDGDRLFEGFTEFPKPYCLNRLAAENVIREFASKEWNVFYKSSDAAFSSLQKMFPFKVVFQAILTLGVLVYFLVLKKISDRSFVN
jgi:hypothetical protein